MFEGIHDLCSLLYSSFYIPIIFIASNDEILFEFPQTDATEQRPAMSASITKTFSSPLNPAFFMLNPFEFYGMITVEQTHGTLFVGPVVNNSFNDGQSMHRLYHHSPHLFDYRELDEKLLPSFNLNSFQHFLMLLHFLINHEHKSVASHFAHIQWDAIEQVISQQVQASYSKKEEQSLHNTYFLEQEMLTYIEQGKTTQLLHFLENKMGRTHLRAGKMSEYPLRQAKNLFLSTATKVGNQAAIPGGMEIEEAYELIDNYTLTCENMTSIDDILKLQYNMLFSFCESVKHSKLSHISAEMRQIVNFIHSRTNQQTSLDDVVQFCHKSKSAITKQFKEEMGSTVNQYIIETKIDEAKNLLVFSEMSLAEIAHALSFSSQSYFSNCFKKVTGSTPYIYKKNYRYKK